MGAEKRPNLEGVLESDDERVRQPSRRRFSRSSTTEQQSRANLRRGGEAEVSFGQIDGRITLARDETHKRDFVRRNAGSA